MPLDKIIYQFLVFFHLAAFAWALALVIKEDYHFVKTKKVDTKQLAASAHSLVYLLAGLWGSGIILIAMKVGTDFNALLGNSKLMAKITVVSILTLNGYFLHHKAFPQLMRKCVETPMAIVIMGAISSTSWMAASMIGACRTLAPYMSYGDFVGLYILAIIYAGLIGYAVSYDILSRMHPKYLMAQRRRTKRILA